MFAIRNVKALNDTGSMAEIRNYYLKSPIGTISSPPVEISPPFTVLDPEHFA